MSAKRKSSKPPPSNPLFQTGEVYEVRAPKTKKGTLSGYFSTAQSAYDAAKLYDGLVPALYMTMNPVQPELLGRANSRIEPYAHTTTSDHEILRREWMLFDFDPKRATGISSTDAEHLAGLDRATAVRNWLTEQGWPAPIEADSGNGGHLLYKIVQPNDEASTALIKTILEGLDVTFSDAAVEVDSGVYNAARITKLYGTMACKGDPLPDRPHRLSQFLVIPSPILPVSLDQLTTLAARFTQSKQKTKHKPHGTALDLRAFLTRHALVVSKEKPWDTTGTLFELAVCPFVPEHLGTASLMQFASGAVAFKCLVTSCADHDWNAFRKLYPDEASDMDAELLRLASLSPLEYGKTRKAAAKALGVTVSILDKAVDDLRKATQVEDGPALETITPADDPVDGIVLADTLTTIIRRFVVIEPAAVHAVVLWVLWTYAFNLWSIAPILALVSPEKRCGKTSLLELLEKLLDRPLLSSNISTAAIFRVIEAIHPVLLVDEMDSFSQEDEPLRGILNSGHTKSAARVIRVVGDGAQMTVKVFSTWCPKVLASLGALPETIEDRSVTIPMKRRKRGETKESLRWTSKHGKVLREELKGLAGQCKRWVEDHTDELSAATPLVPDTLNDRAADNWHVLLCVAEVLGGFWADKANEAALRLSGAELETDSIRIQLLRDIQTILKVTPKIGSVSLCTALINTLESPWGTWKRGQGITPSQLARQLRPFGVSSRNIKESNGSVVKGYEADDFQEVFERYLPPMQEPEVERF